MPADFPGLVDRLAIVMVGLPARGKTFMARKLARYLAWQGFDAKVFNVGNYRRERVGAQMAASYFDPHNAEANESRRQLAMAALDDMLEYFANGGRVGIYDATNSTRGRRTLVRSRLEGRGIAVLFVESVCEDERIVEQNIRDTKLRSPDYAGMDPEAAVRDFRERIRHYESVYETLTDLDGSSVQVVDVGRRIVLHRIRGWLAGRIVNFLVNLHVTPRPIWLCRHGESAFNALGMLGGDPPLTERGAEYAVRLAKWLDDYARGEGEIAVWTSTLRRTRDTAALLGVQSRPWRLLDEIDAGVCDGMTYAQVKEKMPEEFVAREQDKLGYRYPRGESYWDVIHRVEPVIVEIERTTEPVLVVAHQAVIRALYAYFTGLPPEECPRLPVPLHTVIELIPQAYGCAERRMFLGPPLGQ